MPKSKHRRFFKRHLHKMKRFFYVRLKLDIINASAECESQKLGYYTGKQHCNIIFKRQGAIRPSHCWRPWL